MSTHPSHSTPNRLRQLRAFCHAAQTGSISKAAERLSVSQPSVSLLIKGLEQDLGVLLFERRGPRIELSAAGQVLLETSLPLVEGMDHLPEVFAARLGEVDFAVGSMIDVPEDITYQPIFTYDPMLITALDHPLAKKKKVTLEDIAPCGLILPPRHLSTWHIVDLVFHQHGLDYRVVLEAGGWEVIKKFVELGLGVSIVTSICLKGDEKLAAIPLKDYFPQRSYGVVMRKGKFLSPQACSFIELMDPVFSRCRRERQEQLFSGGRPAADGTPAGVDFTGHDRSLP